MKRLLSCLFALVFCVQLYSQNRFTYVTDRQFYEPSDLIGYQFVPAGMEKPGDYDMELSPGEYSFGITAKNLYIQGEEIKGVFSINTINSTDYGFRLQLMNARNPSLQGHLKIILTKNRYVQAMVFKRSKTDSEIIFLLAQTPKDERAADQAFFTNYGDLIVENVDSLWGQKIRPFFVINSTEKTQSRIVPKDSVSIQFIETIEIIEKIKKPKKKKKKTAKEIEEMAASVPPELPNMELDSIDTDEAPIVKTKIIKRYSIEVKSFLQYNDGTSELKVWNFPIEKVTERADEAAQAGEEKFQISFQSGKGKELYLYMTTDRKVTAFEMGTSRYEMR